MEADLPDAVRARTVGWPSGCYVDQADAFRSHWQGESGPRAVKVDWDKAWHSWIRRAGSPKAPPKIKLPRSADLVRSRPSPPVVERAHERDVEIALREALEPVLGTAVWWPTAAFRIGAPGVKLFVLPWLGDSAAGAKTAIGKAAKA